MLPYMLLQVIFVSMTTKTVIWGASYFTLHALNVIFFSTTTKITVICLGGVIFYIRYLPLKATLCHMLLDEQLNLIRVKLSFSWDMAYIIAKFYS